MAWFNIVRYEFIMSSAKHYKLIYSNPITTHTQDWLGYWLGKMSVKFIKCIHVTCVNSCDWYESSCEMLCKHFIWLMKFYVVLQLYQFDCKTCETAGMDAWILTYETNHSLYELKKVETQMLMFNDRNVGKVGSNGMVCKHRNSNIKVHLIGVQVCN